MEERVEVETSYNSSYYLYIALTIILIYCILMRVIVIKFFPSNGKLPPGPWGLPILGNLLQMVKNPHLKFSQWARTYGDICTIQIGTRKAVLVSDPKLLMEIFRTMASTGKSKTDAFTPISQGPYEIINIEGNACQEQRSFSVEILMEFSTLMVPVILEGIGKVCECMHEAQGTTKSNTVILDTALKPAILNMWWTIVSGERVKLGESKMAKLMHTLEQGTQRNLKTGLGFFPWWKYLIPSKFGNIGFDKVYREINAYVGTKFKEHTKTYEEGERRDVMDIYIEQLRKIEKDGKNLNPTFQGESGVKNCVASISKVFVAGGEATTEMCEWVLHYLAVNQKAQDALKKEIDNVIGRNREPLLEDRLSMPYAEAVILETFRLSSILPFGFFHEFLEDFHFEDYIFPKGTLLVPNMYHIHHNPDIWSEPEEFRPERFLSGNESKVLKEYLVPCQAGKRQYLGEHLAKDMLFLFITKLTQQFQVKIDPSVSTEKYLKPDVGIGIFPKKYGLLMTSRKYN